MMIPVFEVEHMVGTGRNASMQHFLLFYNVFKTQPLCSGSLQPSPVFVCLHYKSFENTVGKGEITRNKQFLLFPQCFYPL